MSEIEPELPQNLRLPAEILDHVGFSAMAKVPVLYLPDDWEPTHLISLDMVRSAVGQGVGLYFAPDMPRGFDLAWIGGQISNARALLFPAAVQGIESLPLLEEASSAVELSTPLTGQVDLSHLNNLRHVSVFGEGYVSALQVDGLNTAVVDIEAGLRDVLLPSSLRQLSVRSLATEINYDRELHNLNALALYQAKNLDVAKFRRFPNLRELVVADCRVLRSVNELAKLHELRTLKLLRVSRIIPVDGLNNLHIREADIFNCPDVSAELAAKLTAAHHAWSVNPGKRKPSSPRFEIVDTDDGGWEILFDDWEQVGSLASEISLGHSLDGDDLERILLEAARKFPRRVPAFTFDSEADTLIAVAQSRADAQKLRRIWEPLFSDVDSFRAAVQGIFDS